MHDDDEDPLAEFDDDVELEVLADDEPEPPAVPAPRPRRRLMGETVDALGAQASARPAAIDPVRLAEQRERAEQSRSLLAGGRNKGEQKGYGIASGRSEPPPPA